jgi:hypothetical protein
MAPARVCCLSLALLVALTSACTFYRTDRTFFEPNAADGKLTKSSSCGFHLSDALERQLPEALVSVAPQYEYEGKRPLRASILVRTPDRDVNINPRDFELRSGDGKVFLPIEVQTQAYGLIVNHPHWSTFITLTYPPLAGELSDITFTFPKGTVVAKGKALDIQPFRFRKVTKEDTYYSSINC